LARTPTISSGVLPLRGFGCFKSPMISLMSVGVQTHEKYKPISSSNGPLSARLDAKTKSLLDSVERVKDGPHRRLDKAVFDGMEQRTASAVFALTAVEAFTNEVISYAYAQGFKYEQKRKRTLIAVLDYVSALEDLRLEEKVGHLLPKVFKIASPRGTLPWQHFRRLIRLRNRIIHLKPQDYGASTDSSLWEDLLNPIDWDFAKQMHSLIGYFMQNMDRSGLQLNTRWFYKVPY
jgi:hypothetical protein